MNQKLIVLIKSLTFYIIYYVHKNNYYFLFNLVDDYIKLLKFVDHSNILYSLIRLILVPIHNNSTSGSIDKISNSSLNER